MLNIPHAGVSGVCQGRVVQLQLMLWSESENDGWGWNVLSNTRQPDVIHKEQTLEIQKVVFNMKSLHQITGC